MRIIAFLKLKEGTNKDEFKKWAMEKDLPAGKKLPCTKSYYMAEIKEVDGIDMKHEFMEIWEVTNKEEWLKMGEFDWMKEIEDAYSKFIESEVTQIFYGNDV